MIRIHGRREFFSSKIDECFILTLEKHSRLYANTTTKKSVMKARRINLYHVQERRVNHMILNMDKIQFESRAEIGTIIKALEDWQEDHEKDETVQELINKLDAMSMNW